MDDLNAPYFKYWGKADREDPSRYHLLPYHCLDVAAVASVWWEKSPVIRRSFLRLTELDEKVIKAWVLFFIALHDYGKIDIRFQRKADHVRQILYPPSFESNLPDTYTSKKYDHGAAGLYWFLHDNNNRFDFEADLDAYGIDFFDNPSQPNEDWHAWRPWIEMVCGHHGFIRREETVNDWHLPGVVGQPVISADLNARLKWVKSLEVLFLKTCGLSLADNPPPPSPLLAGFCSVADWLGSRSDENNFVFSPEPASINDYFNEKMERDAGNVIKLSGIVGENKTYKGVMPLLPANASPHGLQKIVNDLPVAGGLTIVEAPTGSGKTEMALAYAWRLIEKGLAESIVFALPTQATANKMYDRLEPLSLEIFASNPNLLLAHGNARFNERFLSIKKVSFSNQMEEEAWAQCCQWLSQSRKRVFLGQIGVCTVDQVLISVLPVRHRFVRGFGLGRSVLIIDEVHAYDAYMYGLVQQVLKDQKAAGGSAVLLSATLPTHQRETLLSAWGMEMKHDKKWEDYPLVTWAGQSKVYDFHIPSKNKDKTRDVKVDYRVMKNMLPDKDLISEMIAAAAHGAQVAMICNLVDDAQQISDEIRRLTDLTVLLFHSRFTLIDRIAIEKTVDGYFGKNGDRSIGRILVGTQVLEQSLDYDVDWMITQLCPVDLMFQRMGRLHRHERTFRPQGFEGPCCTILGTDTDGYGRHDKVYGNTLVMWRTDKILLENASGSIEFPAAFRAWIEPIYDERIKGEEPPWVLGGHEKYKDELIQKKFAANQMIKWSRDVPLADTDQNILAVTRDGEMSLQLVPFVQVASGKKLIDGRIIESLSEDKIPEAIALNSINVPRGWEHWIDTVDQDDTVWLPMNVVENVWSAKWRKGRLIYTKTSGLKQER